MGRRNEPQGNCGDSDRSWKRSQAGRPSRGQVWSHPLPSLTGLCCICSIVFATDWCKKTLFHTPTCPGRQSQNACKKRQIKCSDQRQVMLLASLQQRVLVVRLNIRALVVHCRGNKDLQDIIHIVSCYCSSRLQNLHLYVSSPQSDILACSVSCQGFRVS